MININFQTLHSLATEARNLLQMWNGCSNHQLVFREIPNLLNKMSDNPLALEETTSIIKVLAKYLNALHAAKTIHSNSSR